MTVNMESIKDRIRKLLNTAKDDAAAEGEIDNALRFAKSLMDKHHLSEEDLAEEPADQYARVDSAEKSRFWATVGSRIYRWESTLASFVSALTGSPSYLAPNTRTARDAYGRAKLDTGKPYEGRSIVFYGVAEDARMSVEIYYELWWTIRSMARLKFGQCYRGDGGMYAEGFVAGLRDKLDEQNDQEKREAIASNDSRSLVLVERRNSLVEYKEQAARTWLKDTAGIKLCAGPRRSGAFGSSSAFGEGMADGRKTSVSKIATPKIA